MRTSSWRPNTQFGTSAGSIGQEENGCPKGFFPSRQSRQSPIWPQNALIMLSRLCGQWQHQFWLSSPPHAISHSRHSGEYAISSSCLSCLGPFHSFMPPREGTTNERHCQFVAASVVPKRVPQICTFRALSSQTRI